MKYILLFFTLLNALVATGQKNIQATDQFTISGSVRSEITVKVSDILTYPSHKIGNLTITNHLGEKKSTLKKLRGVRLLDVLKMVQIDNAPPKLLSEHYLVFVASDGYQVVFSWNEVFNSPLGQNIYLLTEINGKTITEMPDRIICVTTSDLRTGRRFVKGLSKILIKRV